MESYEILKSEKMFSGIILDVVHETIVLPSGKESVREVVVRGPAAAIVAVDGDGVVLIRQFRTAVRENILEIPAGMMEEGEDPLECAIRELSEETGLVAGKISLLTEIYMTVGFCTEKIHICLAEELTQGKQNLDEDEFLTIEKYKLNDAISMIFSGEIKDSKTIVGLLAYNERVSRIAKSRQKQHMV